MVTIDGIPHIRTECGKMIPVSEVSSHVCCLACIVILSEFPVSMTR